MRELVGRAPERLTLAFVSRQQPTLPLARLRTLGEVAELTAADLRFDLGETERLFRDTYKRPLEPDVLADLADRTEGWAASLEMVNAALRDRSPVEVRAFVHGMTGAHGELVRLPRRGGRRRPRRRDAAVPHDDLTAPGRRPDARRSRRRVPQPSREGAHRGRRASRAAVDPGVGTSWCPSLPPARPRVPRVSAPPDPGRRHGTNLHRAVARHAGTADWRLAAYHFAAADDMADLGVVVQTAVPTIMGSGEFALAESYVQRAGPENNAAFELFVSRMELHRGLPDGAVRSRRTRGRKGHGGKR